MIIILMFKFEPLRLNNFGHSRLKNSYKVLFFIPIKRLYKAK